MLRDFRCFQKNNTLFWFGKRFAYRTLTVSLRSLQIVTMADIHLLEYMNKVGNYINQKTILDGVYSELPIVSNNYELPFFLNFNQKTINIFLNFNIAYIVLYHLCRFSDRFNTIQLLYFFVDRFRKKIKTW